MNIKVNVTLVKNQKVKGSATVVLDDCFKIRDIVILEVLAIIAIAFIVATIYYGVRLFM